MQDILSQIVAAKKREIAAMGQPPLPEAAPAAQSIAFYERLAAAKAAGKPFFIAEFKRKSPSEGWIDERAVVAERVRQYIAAGAGAISVLTDGPFFGGSYQDLSEARRAAEGSGVLLLQKDFVLEPAQLYSAKAHGADIVLLIAAILTPEKLDFLRQTAESIGLGVLVEVHDEAEWEKIRHLGFPVLGINNRDLKTFRTSLNRANVLAARQRSSQKERFVVAESGVLDWRHFQVLRHGADGFLVGTGLMRSFAQSAAASLPAFFHSNGRLLFKACGVRNLAQWEALAAQSPPDFLGINFSPRSKRRYTGPLPTDDKGGKGVAVFYQNSPEEILDILQKSPFRTAQLYAGDFPSDLLREIRQRVLLAVKIGPDDRWDEIVEERVAPYAADVDCFILDGAKPGSGERIETAIPPDFPYPFLLAGGLSEGNLDAVRAHPNCIGADIASGIETEGALDLGKIERIGAALAPAWL